MKLTALIDKVGHKLSFLLIPHHGNNHHPWATRHQGLLIFAVGILFSQILTNIYVGKPPLVLGFATDIKKDQLISLTNQQRQQNGASVLTESEQLSQAALLKAQDMFANNYWAHVSPSGTTPWYFFNLTGYKYIYAGENLARGFDTSNGVIQGWLDSPSHRENMLNPNYTNIGMAVVNGQLSGESTTLVVQLFGTPTSTAAVSTSQPKAQTPPTPTSTPKPTIVAIASRSASIVVPVTPSGSFSPPAGGAQVLTVFKPAGSLNLNQQVLLLSLLILAAIFLVDAFVLVRKRLLHQRPHAILHALVIISLIGFLIISGKGAIL